MYTTVFAANPNYSLSPSLTIGSELGMRTTSLRVAVKPTHDRCCWGSLCCCWPVAAAAAAALAAVEGTKAWDIDGTAASRLRAVSHNDDGNIFAKIAPSSSTEGLLTGYPPLFRLEEGVLDKARSHRPQVRQSGTKFESTEHRGKFEGVGTFNLVPSSGPPCPASENQQDRAAVASRPARSWGCN